jgi:hypothetical protein
MKFNRKWIIAAIVIGLIFVALSAFRKEGYTLTVDDYLKTESFIESLGFNKISSAAILLRTGIPKFLEQGMNENGSGYKSMESLLKERPEIRARMLKEFGYARSPSPSPSPSIRPRRNYNPQPSPSGSPGPVGGLMGYTGFECNMTPPNGFACKAK